MQTTSTRASKPSQFPDPVRERAHSEKGRKIERATADRPVAGPDEEDDITVQIARWESMGETPREIGAWA